MNVKFSKYKDISSVLREQDGTVYNSWSNIKNWAQTWIVNKRLTENKSKNPWSFKGKSQVQKEVPLPSCRSLHPAYEQQNPFDL